MGVGLVHALSMIEIIICVLFSQSTKLLQKRKHRNKKALFDMFTVPWFILIHHLSCNCSYWCFGFSIEKILEMIGLFQLPLWLTLEWTALQMKFWGKSDACFDLVSFTVLHSLKAYCTIFTIHHHLYCIISTLHASLDAGTRKQTLRSTESLVMQTNM